MTEKNFLIAVKPDTEGLCLTDASELTFHADYDDAFDHLETYLRQVGRTVNRPRYQNPMNIAFGFGWRIELIVLNRELNPTPSKHVDDE